MAVAEVMNPPSTAAVDVRGLAAGGAGVAELPDGREVLLTHAGVTRPQLDALGVDFTEVAYDREPDVHRRVGVTGVPLLVIRDETGQEVRRFAGVMPKARLALALVRGGS